MPILVIHPLLPLHNSPSESSSIHLLSTFNFFFLQDFLESVQFESVQGSSLFFFKFLGFSPSLLMFPPFSSFALLPEGRGISDKWVNPRSLVPYLKSLKLWTFTFPKLAYKVHENRILMRKDCLAWFWAFPPFHLAKHAIWIEDFGILTRRCCQKPEAQRHTKLKQNENKLAKGFEAKNNLVCRVQVLRKGSGSEAGKYLIWYGLNLPIDTVSWSFTIWTLYSTWVWKKEELYLFCQIPAWLGISKLCFMPWVQLLHHGRDGLCHKHNAVKWADKRWLLSRKYKWGTWLAQSRKECWWQIQEQVSL